MKIRLGFIILFCILAVSLTAQPARSDSIVRVGACATPGVAFGVHVQGDYAYIADGGRLTVVNVADSSNPYVVSYYSDVHVAPVGVFVQDTVAYNNNGLVTRFSTVSVANPESLYRLGWCFTPTTGVMPKGIVVSDTIAYLAHGTKGVQIINVAQPDSPYIIIAYDTPGYAFDLRIRDTLLYIADNDSLQIANVAVPNNPFRVGACGMPSGCWDVDIKDNYAYVACQSNFGTDGRLILVYISNPSNPLLVDEVYMNGDPIAVFIEGNYAYVAAVDYWTRKGKRKRDPFEMRSRNHPDSKADVEGGLRIVDISQPDNLELVTSYDTPGYPEDVFVVGEYIYVADEDSLQILKHIMTGIEEISSRRGERVLELSIHPNPIYSSANIHYQLSISSHISLKIFDITGKLVKTIHNGYQENGSYTAVWSGKDDKGWIVSKGVYFIQAKTYKFQNKVCEKVLFLGGKK